MKLYLTATVNGYSLHTKKPFVADWGAMLDCLDEKFLRECGFTRKLPTGKQVLAVKLTIR